MDKDGSGTMTADEFSDALSRMGLGLTALQVAEVLAAVDADGNGTVEYAEFVSLLGVEFERPASAPAQSAARPARAAPRVASAGVARSRKVYGNRDALGFEEPPDLAAYRHVPVYQSCFPVYCSRVFQKAAPDLATSNRHAVEDEEVELQELRGVPTDAMNSKTLPATMHAQHAIDWSGTQVPRARPSSAAALRNAGAGRRPPAGRRRPQSAASNLQRKSITMSKDTKVEREVENVFRVISQQLRGKRTLYGEVMAEARDVFNLIDKDRSRTLDKQEFTTALNRMGLGLTEDQVEEVIAVVDKDGNGTIEYPEFVALLGAEWSRPRSAPAAKTRFGASQRPRSGAARRANSRAGSAASTRRPGSAPVMDRYSTPQQYPNGWKPRRQRQKQNGTVIQHVPAVGNADASYWGWQETPGAPGHKTWIDDYKGGVAIEQLTPRRAAWNDKIKREAASSARPANLGWCRDTMTMDSMDRPQSAPSRPAVWQEQRAKELEASRASNAHFSRWKPRKATPKKSRSRELSASKHLEPVPQAIEVQTDPLAEYHNFPAVVLDVVAAGGFPSGGPGDDVFCRVRFGNHERETSLLPAHVPHPLPESVEPVCLFGEDDHTHFDNFVLVDCFARVDGESRSVHRGTLRLALEHKGDNPNRLRFFKFSQRSEISREAQTPQSNEAQTPNTNELRRQKSYGFGFDPGPLPPESGAHAEWNEVFQDTTGSPPRDTCPEGWIALKMHFTDQAGSTTGSTRKVLEKAVEKITQETAKRLGTLNVTVCRGRRLAKEHTNKLLDPICQLEYRKEAVSTSVAFNTVSPEWNETFMFDVADLNEELRIMVYDWSDGAESYDLVGAAVLGMVEELDVFEESERWVELFSLRPDGTLRRRGDIFCMLQFTQDVAAPAAGDPRTDLLIGTSVHSICLQLECIEARGLLVHEGVKLCCNVSLYQPLHETQSHSTAGVPVIVQGQGEDTSECTAVWRSLVNLTLVEPTAVVRVDVAAMPENIHGRPKVLGGFVVPAAHLMKGHKNGEWFQLVDVSELDGPATGSAVAVDFNKATHTHAAALYFDAEHSPYRARNYGNVKWQYTQNLGMAAIHVRSKMDVRAVQRVASKSPKGSAPPGSLLDETSVGAVSVAVVRATGLSKVRGAHGLKDPDPYVQVFHGSDRFVTPTVRSSRLPSWVDGEQQWFTFPVSTIRSIVQFKICSRALVGPDILLGSLSIGLREMVPSASQLDQDLPDPSDPKVLGEHKLLGVSEVDLDSSVPGDKRTRKKLEDNGILHLATHLQLRSLDQEQVGAPLLPATRRLRSVVLTTDFLSNDQRFEVITEDSDEEEEEAPQQRGLQSQMPRKTNVNAGVLMCIEVNILECSALQLVGLSDRDDETVNPLVRVRLEDKPEPPPQKPVQDGSGSDDEERPADKELTDEYKAWLDNSAEVLMVVLNMQCIFRGKLARRDFRYKRQSLELYADSPAPCKFQRPEGFRLHTNDFSKVLVVEVLHEEPGKLPMSIGSVEMPVSSLSLPSATGEHWHMLAPPGYLLHARQVEMQKVATLIQSAFRGRKQRKDYQRRITAPIHVVYLLGGPGSGKTALGERLVKDLGLIHLSTGEMLRRALRQKENRDVANRIRVSMADGVAVPNDILMPLLQRAIARLRFYRGGGTFVLDGVPVSESQRSQLEDMPDEQFPYPVRVFLLDCEDETMISRCIEKSRKQVGKQARDDYDEETVSTGVSLFRKAGMRVVEHYGQEGILTKIDNGSDVTEDKAYSALKAALIEWMVDAGHWDESGHDPTRTDLEATLSSSNLGVVQSQDGDTPKEGAIRLRIGAHRSGLTTTSRTLIGVMRWRRKARLGSLLKAKEAEGATKLGPVAEGEGEAEEQDTGPGGLTVEV
jgi:adenylate kinase family enzyme/Ca2+-binding EF-hand superfamily protein